MRNQQQIIVNNKYKFTVPGVNQTLTIPIEMNWDFYGRDDSIEVYQDEVIKVIAGIPEDFEVIRFGHESYGNNEKTELKYDFHFYSGVPTNVTSSTANDWVVNFTSEGFTPLELFYRTKPFVKSFFKLDFYNSPDGVNQTNSFTVILPVYKCNTILTNISSTIQNVKINIPRYTMDYISSSTTSSTNEGFFLYWLKSRTFINLDTFYMTVKFFDAKQGVYVRMMTVPQSSLPNKFVFDNENFFYNKVVLDYDNKTYKIFDYLGNRLGVNTPIKWYEYVNP